MSLKSEIKKDLEKYNISPKKYLGQNFLISPWVYKKILTTSDLSPDDEVLEVGAGLGCLTLLLSQRCKKVIAIEKDKEMFKILVEKTRARKNIVCILADARKFNPEKYGLKIKKYKIVANLPYYLTSFFLRIFLERYPPKEMILLIQKEVAKKIIAANKKESLLSLSVKFFAQPQIVTFIGKENFWPQPKIDSALVRLKIREEPLLENNEKKLFFKIIHAGFSSPRKKIKNNLSRILDTRILDKRTLDKILKEANISPNSRSEDVPLKSWISFTKFFSSAKIKK